MQPLQLVDPSDIPSCQLEDWGPVKEPEGACIAAIRGRRVAKGSNGVADMGIWECSPGRWRRQVMHAEFTHFLAGQARFYPDRGKPFDIRAGDSIWFPMNTTGIWDIKETLRKSYVMIEPPTMASVLRKSLWRFWRMLNARTPASVESEFAGSYPDHPIHLQHAAE